MLEKIESALIGESCTKYVHSSGVTVFMYPMDKRTACAQFAVRFGSMDNRYRLNGADVTEIPDGTAHYLEHKLFESEEKNAFALFAQTGASCNAGTSYESTVYYFSAAGNFAENLKILLGFVQDPFFTPENVEKERGIIEQEITMYEDTPNWRVLMEMLKGVYSENPIKTDVAGTAESISHITDRVLYELYDVFYNPSNMYLCISGGFDPEEAMRVCDECLKDREPLDFESVSFSEPEMVTESYREVKMPVGKPLLAMGFKLPDGKDSSEALENYTYYNIIFDAIFGESSEFYSIHRDSGLINDAFRSSVLCIRNTVLPIITGESDDPQQVLSLVKQELRRIKSEGISEKVFKRLKKATYGGMLRSFNQPENVAQSLVDGALNRLSPFAWIEAVAAADYGVMLDKLRALDEENVCLAVINPL